MLRSQNRPNLCFRPKLIRPPAVHIRSRLLLFSGNSSKGSPLAQQLPQETTRGPAAAGRNRGRHWLTISSSSWLL